MGKFCKPGKVVIILNGRYAGHKGIILKSNYEGLKNRPYAHCLVAGIAKGPRKATKRNLAKIEQRIRDLESKDQTSEQIAKLKRFGVFIKTFNMSHLLFTRYNLKDDFGTTKLLDKLDTAEKNINDTRIKIEERQKSKEEDKTGLEKLKTKLGQDLSNYKEELAESKVKIGTEMYKRYMKGFVRNNNTENNERQEHTEFLFKKLKF